MDNLERKIDNLLPQLDLYSENNPDKFEAIRAELIEALLESFPDEYRQRARGIQFALDCELRKYKNPVSRMNRMVEIFWKQVDEFQAAVNNPLTLSSAKKCQQKPAKVIPLFAASQSPETCREDAAP